jgi:mono/diheme cytochrome c family protein
MKEEVKPMSLTVRGLRYGVVGLLLAAGLTALWASMASAAPPSQSAADGEAIFKAKCTACHTIGGGVLVGPDLKGVTQRADPVWLASFIAAPDKLFAESDPAATALLRQFNNVQMPNLGLSQTQVAALIAYLETQGGATGTPQPTQPITTTLPAGDSKRGEDLFLGLAHLQAGGPPCMGCHSIDKEGALGGGVLGPNLGQAFAKYGGAGLAAALANIPFPTMKPIFANHPLAPQDQADLRAFLEAKAGAQLVNTEWLVIGLSLAGLFGALIVIWFIWRHRLRGVRRPLVKRTTQGAGTGAARVREGSRRVP